jgi:glycosyltransferase involved in cell wall biosynthesis
MQIIIGIPAYNEEKNIAKIIVKLQNITNKIIVCNDGSTDLTSEIADKMGAIVINHPKNLGYGAAIKSLFSKARELDADVLITFDADGQHRIEDIKKVLEPIEHNNADIVIGSRFLDNKIKIPAYRKLGINVITKMSNITTKKKITDSQSGFRAYNKKSLQEIILSDNGMGVSTEILIKANKKSLRVIEVSITILYEGETSTHNPVSHGMSVMLSTMKFISIEHPLKFYGIPGLIFLLTGFIFIIWTLQIYTEYNSIITNIALVGIGATIVAMMFLMTSIILYSLVNVVREGKNR